MSQESIGIIDGGEHAVTAGWEKMSASDLGFNVITFRVDKGASDIWWGVGLIGGGVRRVMFMEEKESWTIGPRAGTVRPSDIRIKGTPNDLVFWVGVKV